MKSQRHLFHLPEDVHYLNCSYKAPLLRAGEEAVRSALERMRTPFKLQPDDFFDDEHSARSLFAELVNCLPSEVALMPSTSYGFASLLANVSGTSKSNAITVANEFPSGYFALKRWCDDRDAELRVIGPTSDAETGTSWNENLVAAIDENTAVVLMSSIHWMTGLLYDVKAISNRCKEVGAKLIVDGTQWVGALPMDVQALGIDALVCATYKWLFGPYSIALAYIGPVFHNGKPIEESWMNRTNAKNFSNLTDYGLEYQDHAIRYSVGEKSNLLTMPLLLEGLKQVHAWTVPGIQSYCKALTEPLLEYLGAIGIRLENEPWFSPHLFSLELDEVVNMEQLKVALQEKKVILSTRGKGLRVATHPFNTDDDIQKLMESIEAARI